MKDLLRTILPCATLCLMLFCGCSGNTYSKQIREEKKLINSYIQKQGIRVLNEAPDVAHGQHWNEKDYVAVEGYDNFYYHLTTAADTTAADLTNGTRINLRYRKYGLTAYADTVNCWTTDDQGDPVQITLGTLGNNSCSAWHIAIRKMGHSGAECRIICPSTIGFTEDNATVTPYVYDLKATRRR
jgi:hypothetical protein